MNWYKKAELKNTDNIIYDIYKSIEGSVGGNWTVKLITDSKNSRVYWLQRILSFVIHGKDVIKQGDSFSVYVRMWIKRASGKVIHPYDGSYEGSSEWGEGQSSKPTGDLEEQNAEIHKRWQALYNMTPEDASIYDSEYGNRLFDIQIKLFGSKSNVIGKESPYEQISITSELDTPIEIAEHVKTEINRYYFGGDDGDDRVEPIDPTGGGYMEPEVTYDQVDSPVFAPSLAQHKNWYKKAQFEQSKVKYDKENNGVYLLSRNTKPYEGPWRISLLSLEESSPLGHQSFLTYEEALEEFNYMPGIEADPDLTKKEVYELV